MTRRGGAGGRGWTQRTARGPLWTWPALAGAVGLVVPELLAGHRPSGGVLAALWPGGVDAASVLVQVVAGSVITATTLILSLTVVALQLASQQFSPRLLREFTRDRVVRVVLAVLVGTFTTALSTLRHLGTPDEVPAALVGLVLVLGVASLAAVLGFLTHVVRILRVDTMMVTVHAEALDAVRGSHPRRDDDEDGGRARVLPADLPDPRAGRAVGAPRSGFVRAVDAAGLVGAAQAVEALVHLLVRPGDHVVQGAPIAVVHPPSADAALDEQVAAALDLGYERTFAQDAAYGFRQLEDIAVKALSPGINDPVTAVHALGYLGDLVVELLGRRLGPEVLPDPRGPGEPPRVVLPGRDLAYYLDLCCGQVRRYGAEEPAALAGVLRLLRDAAGACRDEEDRAAVARQVDLVEAEVGRGRTSGRLLEEDRDAVLDLVERARRVLDGDAVAPYVDRAGETRSV